MWIWIFAIKSDLISKEMTVVKLYSVPCVHQMYDKTNFGFIKALLTFQNTCILIRFIYFNTIHGIVYLDDLINYKVFSLLGSKEPYSIVMKLR